jgi:undecaprenyl-diphosphatase
MDLGFASNTKRMVSDMNKKHLRLSLLSLFAFAVWTAALFFVDVQAIGPQGSSVGFASLNQWVHDLTGVHMTLYTITDWLGLIPIVFMLGFAILGAFQWIKRRHLCAVDRSILALGGFYLLVMAAYILFEFFVVNRRPILIDGYLEASYPSSTTLLVLCVMPTAALQLHSRTKNRIITIIIVAFMLFMVIGRLISGVHWFSDIVGGLLLSLGLVHLYRGVSGL